MNDRIVHGYTADGGEVVRYDRAGKWYIEYSGSRRHVGVREAAREADRATLGLFGGGRFDALVEALRQRRDDG